MPFLSFFLDTLPSELGTEWGKYVTVEIKFVHVSLALQGNDGYWLQKDLTC